MSRRDVREEAANLLSALASDAAAGNLDPSTFYPPGDWSRATCEVAHFVDNMVFSSAHRNALVLPKVEQLAEAEARVRDGSIGPCARVRFSATSPSLNAIGGRSSDLR